MNKNTLLLVGVLAYLYFRNKPSPFVGPILAGSGGPGYVPPVNTGGPFVGPIQPSGGLVPYPPVSCTDINGNIFQVSGNLYTPNVCPDNSLPLPGY